MWIKVVGILETAWGGSYLDIGSSANDKRPISSVRKSAHIVLVRLFKTLVEGDLNIRYCKSANHIH